MMRKPGKASANNTILYSHAEWSKLQSLLNENRRIKDRDDRKRQELVDMADKSKQIKDTFVESKGEQKLRIKLHHEKDKYEKELKNTEEERKREKMKIIEETRRALKKNKPGCRALDSALRLADTLRDRKKQLEFEMKIKEVEKNIEKEYADKIFQSHREFQMEKRREKEENMLNKNINFKNVTQTLKELRDERDRIRNTQIKEELREIDRVKDEIRAIDEAKKRKKEETMKFMVNARKESEYLQLQKKEESKKEEELVKASGKLINQVTREITDKKNKFIQEGKSMELKNREKTYQHLASVLKSEEDNEEDKLMNYLANAEEKYMEEQKLESERRAILNKEKNDSYREYVQNMEEQKRIEKEVRKWDIMKRLKMSEVDKEMEERERELEREKKRLQRDHLDMQIKEQKYYAEEKKLTDEDAMQRSALLRQLYDQEVLRYGEKVLRDCDEKERPILPVVKALERYKRAEKRLYVEKTFV